jgi:hypothetical protein
LKKTKELFVLFSETVFTVVTKNPPFAWHCRASVSLSIALFYRREVRRSNCHGQVRFSSSSGAPQPQASCGVHP